MNLRTCGPIVMAKKTVYLTKKYLIRGSHQLAECFKGQTANEKELSLHGHHYEVYITLKGPQSKESGLIINRDQFDQIINKVLIKKYDKSFLNDFMNKPTGENLVMAFTKDIMNSPLKNQLHQVQLKETSKNFFSGPVCNE